MGLFSRGREGEKVEVREGNVRVKGKLGRVGRSNRLYIVKGQDGEAVFEDRHIESTERGADGIFRIFLKR